MYWAAALKGCMQPLSCPQVPGQDRSLIGSEQADGLAANGRYGGSAEP